MVRHSLKRAVIGFTAISALAISSSLSAAPMSLRAFAEQQMRVATIGYRLNAANANSCGQPQMLTGMVLHDLSQYDPDVRAVRQPGFLAWVRVRDYRDRSGSAAERAGLRIDDEILALDGTSVEDPEPSLVRANLTIGWSGLRRFCRILCKRVPQKCWSAAMEQLCASCSMASAAVAASWHC